MAFTLLVVQACDSKSERKVAAETETATSEENGKTVADRKAKLEKERLERAELRRVEFEKVALVTPTYTDAAGNIVYNKAETSPTFDGGDKAMMKYLNNNVKYPAQAEADGVEGTVFVDFIIAKDGTVREVISTETTNSSVDQSFIDEAVRVVSGMPKWIPGSQHGTAVDVRYSIPITFQLR